MPENGGVPLRSRPQPRQAYHEVELDRWRKRLGMPLVLRPKHYPTNNEFSARMVIAADRLGLDALALSHALLHALWSEERDVTDPAVRIDVANRLGLDGPRLQAMEDDPGIHAAWVASHEEATERGVFGTPTWIYKDVLYWGQDRLDFLDEALSQAKRRSRSCFPLRPQPTSWIQRPGLSPDSPVRQLRRESRQFDCEPDAGES